MSIPAPGTRGAMLRLSLDPVEHQRWAVAAAAPLTDWSVLDLLLTLPVGLPVPLTPWERQTLGRVPRGAAAVTADGVIRLAVRPCRVKLATVTGAPIRRDLERAGRFAPYCARTLAVSRSPRRRDFLAEADFWGIGVVLATDVVRETLVRPRPWTLRRHTSAGWRFVELAYQAAITTAEEEETPR